MKNSFRIIFPAFLTVIFSAGCNSFLKASSALNIENKSLLKDSALNSVIEEYVDKYLSEIIRIEHFNRESNKKAFCVHKTAYVEQGVNMSDSVDAYINIFCVEAKPNELRENGKLVALGTIVFSNAAMLESKIYLQKTKNLFHVVTQETPRSEPYYIHDKQRIFSNEIMDRLNKVRINPDLSKDILRKKALAYFKTHKDNCLK
jgi:hypothetical protein